MITNICAGQRPISRSNTTLTKRYCLYAHDRNISAINAAFVTTIAEISSDSTAARVLRYTYAAALYTAGSYEQAADLAFTLAEDYYTLLSLSENDVLGAGEDQVRERLPQTDTTFDDTKRLADCLALYVRCHRNMGTPYGLAAMRAMKFYSISHAWRSAVISGQDVADDFVGIGAYDEALQLLNGLLELCEEYDLADLVIGLRSQRAVVMAYNGDPDAARAQISELRRYRLTDAEAFDIAHQSALIDVLSDGPPSSNIER